jgi:hypothetical protein
MQDKITSLVYTFLTLQEGVAYRRTCRRNDEQGAFHVHRLLLTWFHLPPTLQQWQWHESKEEKNKKGDKERTRPRVSPTIERRKKALQLWADQCIEQYHQPQQQRALPCFARELHAEFTVVHQPQCQSDKSRAFKLVVWRV